MRLANGRELSAIEVQEEYYERTERFLERRGPDPQAKQLLQEWREALDALILQQPERLVRKIDWVAKQALIESYRERHQLPLSHPRVALLDLAYHDVNRTRGLYYVLERSGKMERAVAEKEIQRAMREPPQTTRAKLEGTSSAMPRRSAATTRSTGCTSSSTTRHSERCCARTRSAAWTSASSS